jgi:hypothetical protein
VADKRVIPIPLKKGLHEGQEASVLPPGFATELINWVPEPTGGVRVRVPWVKCSTTSAPATKVGKGIGFHRKITNRNLPAKVQYAQNTTLGNSVTTTISAATAGNLIIAILVSWDSGAAPGGATGPAGYTRLGTDYVDTTRFVRIEVWTKTAVGGETSVAVTAITASDEATLFVFEYTNVRAVEDATGSGASAGSTAFSIGPSTAPSSAEENELFLAAAYLGSTAVPVFSNVASGWTFEPVVDSGSRTMVAARKVQAGASAAETLTATIGSSIAYSGRILSLKATVASPVYTTTVLAGQKQSASEMRVYGIDQADLTGDTWELIDTISGLTSVDPPIAFTMGLGAAYYTHPGWAATRKWAGSGATAAAVSGSPAGRCLAFANNRLFVAGTDDVPYRLYFSAINDAATWPAANVLDIGARDGEAIEDITPFEDGILIGKRTSVHFLAGTGPENFVRRQLLGGACAPGRSIIATPYGAVIAGPHHVYLWSGGTVDKISDAIRSSYAVTGDYVSSSFIDGTVYIVDEGSGTVYALDMENGAWRIEEVSDANEAPSALYNLDREQYMVARNGSSAFMSYRQFPGTARAKDWDSLSETFTFTTPEVWPEGPYTRVTPFHLYVQVRQRGGSEADGAIQVVPIYDGVEYPAREIAMRDDRTTYRERLDIGEQAAAAVESVAFRITHTVASGDAHVCDIEGPLLLEFEPARRY